MTISTTKPPISPLVLAALSARGLSDTAIARLLRVPRTALLPLKRGQLELTDMSLQLVETEVGEGWESFVVSTLGLPGKFTNDTLRVLRDLSDAKIFPRTRRGSRNARASA